jgi:protein-disulfide isomerase
MTTRTDGGVARSTSGRLLRTLDVAASVASLAGGLAVLGVAAAMYVHQRPSSPTQVIPKEPVSLESAALQGSTAAPAVLVVFSDFECPFCRAFARNVLPRVIDTFVTPGKFELAYFQLPLAQIHPLAVKAAREALCAQAQGHYWQMHQELFEAPNLSDSDLNGAASAVGLDVNEFQLCMREPTSAMLESQIALSRSLDVDATPTFFVGVRAGAQSVRVVRRFNRSRTFEQVAAQLDGTVADGKVDH